MTGRLEQLEDAIEKALTAGLALSTLMLVIGLVMGATEPLGWGVLLLMLTPVARVAVVTLGLALEGDWTFTLVSVFVLAVLVGGVWMVVRG